MHTAACEDRHPRQASHRLHDLHYLVDWRRKEGSTIRGGSSGASWLAEKIRRRPPGYTIHPSSRASIPFFPVLFSVHGVVRLSALAFGKFFERGVRLFFTCIWSAANRPDRLVPKVGIDNFALIVLALAHDIIILRRLRMIGIHVLSATGLHSVSGICHLEELKYR